MAAETIDEQQTLDDAFENILVLEPPSPTLDEDWMPGEFDIA